MKSAIKEIGVNKKVMAMLMLTVLTIVLITQTSHINFSYVP